VTLPDQIRTVKCVVAEQFGITVADIDGRRRPDSIAFPRQVAMTYCVKWLHMKTTQTGQVFNRHHGDVLHALRRVASRSQLYIFDRIRIESINEKLAILLLLNG
jgi:chromosomal replication initiator protein